MVGRKTTDRRMRTEDKLGGKKKTETVRAARDLDPKRTTAERNVEIVFTTWVILRRIADAQKIKSLTSGGIAGTSSTWRGETGGGGRV